MTTIAREILAKTGTALPIIKAAYKPKNLYELLNTHKDFGVGQRVVLQKWINKGFQDCYYEITKIKLKEDLRHGRAWGVMVWKGRTLDEGKPKKLMQTARRQWRLLEN
ncbi:uncharacterized protein VTP21DRAFT_8545 [Calcarisporiella thermophila]|uniref:uncharacterized protein n=1 Tax=Calcarisporiella thermophila TaxID=911321 RepID=UPI003742F80F